MFQPIHGLLLVRFETPKEKRAFEALKAEALGTARRNPRSVRPKKKLLPYIRVVLVKLGAKDDGCPHCSAPTISEGDTLIVAVVGGECFVDVNHFLMKTELVLGHFERETAAGKTLTIVQ